MREATTEAGARAPGRKRGDAAAASPRWDGGGAPGSHAALALAVMHEVLLALAHGAPQETTLGIVAEKARLLTDCASAAVALTSGDRESVTFAAVSGDDSAELLGTQVLVRDTIAGNTARTGEPHLAFSPESIGRAVNGQAPEGAAAAQVSAQTRSAAVVPIFEGGVPVGALAALNKESGRPFGGDDLLSLSTLAAAASVTLAYHRHRDDAQRQGRELSTLYEAVRSVAGQLSAQEILSAVLEQAAAHIESSGVAVFLVNDERTHLYIAADRGLNGDQRDVTLPADSGLGRAVLAATRPLFLSFTEDVEEEALPASPPSFEAPFPGLPARSGLAAPIRSGDLVHGLVLAVSGQPEGVYTLADANLLSALAAQAAVAMENAWLYEDATRRAEEASALYELSQTITSTLRLPDVLDLVADSVLNLVSVDKFALFLREGRSERLQLVVDRGLAEGAGERLQPLIGQGIAGWVMEFETPTAVQDVAADHRNASAPLHNEGVVSMTCMPLQVGAATIGVLCALSSRRRLFTVAEMELLYTIANQAAIAIENARIYADMRQKALELRRYFHRVARALGSSQSPGAVPKLITSLTLEVMGADRCALYSLEAGPDGPDLVPLAALNFRPAGGNEGGRLPATEDTPAGWVARRARTLTIEDLATDERFAAARGMRGGRIRGGSYLGVPLRTARQVVGVLEIYTRAPRIWRVDEVRLLLTFASQATVALENARLIQESGRAARDADLLQDLLAMATSPHGAGEPWPLVARLADGLEAGAAALTRSEDSKDWLLRAAHNVTDEEAAGLGTLLSSPSPARGLAAVSRDGNTAVVLIPGAAPPPARAAELLRCAAELLSRERIHEPERLPN